MSYLLKMKLLSIGWCGRPVVLEIELQYLDQTSSKMDVY
jgi:hypothetical protein